MGQKDKLHKKEKKRHKEKSSKSRKERKRERSLSTSGSDSEEERQRQRAEKKARKVEEYWNKQSNKGGPAKFVWGKKIERDLMAGKDVREFTAASQQRQHEERMAEIEKVQKRREEREAEKQRMEEELAMLQRQRLAAEAVEQEQKEEEFHLQQAQIRAARRLAQGRAKPIDWLVQDLYGIGGEADEGDNDDAHDSGTDSEEEREQLRRQIEPDKWTEPLRKSRRQREGRTYKRPRGMQAEPYQVMAGLAGDDLQELVDEIRGYQELESRVTPLHAEYWGCLLTLAEHELAAFNLLPEQERTALNAQAALKSGYGQFGNNSFESNFIHGGGFGGRGGFDRGGWGGGPPQHGAAGAAGAAPTMPVRAVGAPLPNAEQRGVHIAVQAEIESLLAGHGYAALQRMERDISRQLAAGEGDPEYWQAVLPRLKIHAAKAHLRETKASLLEARLAAQEEKLDVAAAMGWLDEAEDEADQAAQQRLGEGGTDALPHGEARLVQEGELPLSDDSEEPEPGAAAAAGGGGGAQQPQRRLHPEEEIEAQAAADAEAAAEAAARSSRLSPPPVSAGELAEGEYDVVGEEEDARLVELLRAQVRIREAQKFVSAAEIAAKPQPGPGAEGFTNPLLDPRNRFRGTQPRTFPGRGAGAGGALETGVGRLGLGQPGEAVDEQTRRLREQAAKAMGMDEGERNFGVEVPVEAQAYWWHNRYAPRKPKYFNRVHTGYEWNKYNQTHYDTENPPPKVVQGYKFNIFYPDLIDRKKAPTYRVELDPSGDKDTCILIFSAGPPYEDIAFRIINKEWETTQRRGFKCTFDRGILHLYFNFKRARYRR